MSEDTELQENGSPKKAGRQERICNALTFAGLFAVIAIGGYSIISGVEKEAEIKAATPTAAPAAEPVFEPKSEELEEEPLPELKEEIPADTVDSSAIDEILVDSVDATHPSHGIHNAADSVGHVPAHHTPVHDNINDEPGHTGGKSTEEPVTE